MQWYSLSIVFQRLSPCQENLKSKIFKSITFNLQSSICLKCGNNIKNVAFKIYIQTLLIDGIHLTSYFSSYLFIFRLYF